ncbi:MAG: acyltransferase [Chloroflexi bacterium]|nr:acyltransferase [Chloroflexota bacterium]
MSEKLGFRRDLEGLRGVAVLLVLLYHARVPFVRGGYVGVDVFFVLSGFLITGIIVRELMGTGRLSLSRFYARRARRLLPAAALVLVVTMIASAILLPPLRVPGVAADTISAALYVSNIRFAVQATDYLGAELAQSPVLHFWSLSVEEQFYIFWPTLLAVAAGAAFLRGRPGVGVRRLAIVLAAVLVVSLGLSIWLTDANQPWAFFSLPTRAWELALGGLLALPGATRWVPSRMVAPAGWIGLALIVAAGVAFDTSVAFPGIAALVPTIGAALVIAAGLPSGPARSSKYAASRVLGLSPMRFLGLISYSLYLWHWPVLVLPEAAVGEALRWPVRLALVGLAIVAATATQRWVEDPIRRGRFIGLKTRRSLALAGGLSVAVVALTASIGLAAGFVRPGGPTIGGEITEVALQPDPTPTPDASVSTDPGASASQHSTPAPPATPPPLAAAPVPADLVPSLATASDDLPVIYTDDCHLNVASVTPGDCVFGDPGGAVTVVLFGDSHAGQWFPALERLATEHGWRLVSMTKSACATADIEIWSDIVKRTYQECSQWRDAALERMAAERPDLVVVSDSRGYKAVIDGVAVPIAKVQDRWDAALGRTLGRLAARARHVVVIGDTPRAHADPAVCLSANLDDATACALPFVDAVNPKWTAGEATVAATSGATFIDPTPWVCQTDPCPAVIGRLLVFRDGHHLTATYARALAERLYARLPPIEP